MAGPWEDYQAKTEPEEESQGPWNDFQPTDNPPGTVVSRVAGAAAEGFTEDFEGKPGLTPETIQSLKDIGLFTNDRSTWYSKPFQAANEAIIPPLAAGADTLLRGLYGGLVKAPAKVAGQTHEEFGGSQGEVNRTEREVENLLNAAGLKYAQSPMGASRRSASGLTKPQESMVKQAVKVGDTDTPIKPPQPPQQPPTIGEALRNQFPHEKAPMGSGRPDPRQGNFAGNIGLDKFDVTDDALQVIRESAKANDDFMDARRGAVSHEETADFARALNMTEDKLMKRVRGEAFNASEIYAATNLLESSALRVKDLAAKFKDPSQNTDELKVQFALAWERHNAIQEQVAGIGAEAGRALNIMRKQANSKDAAQLKELIEGAGGTQRLEDLSTIIDSINDPVAASQLINKLNKPTLSDMGLELWINALLSGPTTHATNILSNALISIYSIPEAAMGEAISTAMRPLRKMRGIDTKDTIRMGETKEAFFGTMEGIVDGIRAGARAFITEEPSDAMNKLDVRKYRSIPSFAGKIVRIPGRSLLAGDEFFKSIAYRQQLNRLALRQAKGEGLKGKALAKRVAEIKADPTDVMVKKSKEFAGVQTFTNPLGDQGKRFMEMTKAWPATRLIVPFIRTPVNIIKYGGKRTPLAALSPEVRANLKGVNGLAAKDQQAANLVMGGMVSAGTVYLSAQGMITGGGPKDPRKRAVMYANGWQPYSAKVGDNYYSFSRLEPLGFLLGTASDFYEIRENLGKKELEDIAYLILESASRQAINKTWLKGPADFMDAITDPERYGEQWVANMAGTLVPTALAQIARTRDPYLREANNMMDKIRSRIPGEREELQPRINLLGRPIKLEGSWGPDILSPIYTSTAKNDPVLDEIIRLDIPVGVVSKKIRGIELTPEEVTQYRMMAGTQFHEAMKMIINSGAWDQLPDDFKADVLKDVQRKTRDAVRQQFLATNPRVLNEIAVQQEIKAQKRQIIP